MMIFLDTEFTDFAVPQLISLGLVVDSSLYFYAERSDFDLANCGDFVRAVVLPKLGRFPGRIMGADQLCEELTVWLSQFTSRQPTIGYDFDLDWTLMVSALKGSVPPWLLHQNINDQIDDLHREWFFAACGLDDHHSLNDAKANRAAYRGRRGRS